MSAGSGGGITPEQLGQHRGALGGLAFRLMKSTNTTDSTYQLFPNGSPYDCVRVLGMTGIMTGAGGGGDTIQLQDGSSNAITEAVSVAALSDKDKWDASVVDDAYYTIYKGDNLKVVTTSAALSLVWVELVHVSMEDQP